jgi:endonuclease YncB( thermonuclease family)
MINFTKNIEIWYFKQIPIVQIILPFIILLPFFIPFFNIFYLIFFSAFLFLFFNHFFKYHSKLHNRILRIISVSILYLVVLLFLGGFVISLTNAVSKSGSNMVGSVEKKSVTSSNQTKTLVDHNKPTDSKILTDIKQKTPEIPISSSKPVNNTAGIKPNLDQEVVNVKTENNVVSEVDIKPVQKKKLFSVISIIDGDTIKISEIGTLRLIGIDTPEVKDPRKPVQCFGKEASNKIKALLLNKKVYLDFDSSNKIDKYGRTLSYVYREDGLFLNLEMIKQGYAHSYIKYSHPKLAEFNSAQKFAMENKLGLWSPRTCNGNTEQPAKSASVKKTTKRRVTSTSVKSNTVVKKSSTGICHAPGTTYYAKTKYFTPYKTLQDCLKSGGRLPKR